MPMEYLCKLALKLATKWTLKKFKFSSDFKGHIIWRKFTKKRNKELKSDQNLTYFDI